VNASVRDDFPVTRERVYLNTAYISPVAVPVRQAALDFLERRTLGTAGRVEDWLVVMDEVRASIGRLVNARPTEIALTTNTSDGTNLVAASLVTGTGQNIVMDDLDYPSNLAIWHAAAGNKNAEVRILKARNGAATVEDFADYVDDSTCAISVSYVSHRNGYRHDLKGLADLAHAHNAYLHVDASQAIGALQLDVKACGLDFMTCGVYKWQLGPLGLAFFYVREELLPVIQSTRYGWMRVETWADSAHIIPLKLHESARKFESATINFGGVHELRAAINYIHEIGIANIERDALRLSKYLYDRLLALGYELQTPPGEQSAIVSCRLHDTETMANLLNEHGIVTTVRPQEIRISPHFFNSEADVDALLNAMEAGRRRV
jgi:selenocysteine lyase/cysteine desulfurase